MEIEFRKAIISDSHLLLRWRNDPLTRENSINIDEIGSEDHEHWLETSLQDPDRQLYIACIRSTPVGTVRFDKHGNEWGLSWTVAPEARGKGIGKLMVKEATQLVEGPLFAQIKPHNQASIRIARFAGFEPWDTAAEATHWKLAK